MWPLHVHNCKVLVKYHVKIKVMRKRCVHLLQTSVSSNRFYSLVKYRQLAEHLPQVQDVMGSYCSSDIQQRSEKFGTPKKFALIIPHTNCVCAGVGYTVFILPVHPCVFLSICLQHFGFYAPKFEEVLRGHISLGLCVRPCMHPLCFAYGQERLEIGFWNYVTPL